jgi:hypothetical protein
MSAKRAQKHSVVRNWHRVTEEKDEEPFSAAVQIFCESRIFY